MEAAVAVAAKLGSHGLSHRAVDDEANVPRGTTSNYFRSREALLAAALTRVVDQHFEWVDSMRARYPGPMDRPTTIAVLSDVVSQAVARHRQRYLAMLELLMESARLPDQAAAVAGAEMTALARSRQVHDTAAPVSEMDLVLVNLFYDGALFTSVVLSEMLGCLLRSW